MTSDGPQTSTRSTNTSLAAALGGKFLTDGLKERWLKQTGRQGETGSGFPERSVGFTGPLAQVGAPVLLCWGLAAVVSVPLRADRGPYDC